MDEQYPECLSFLFSGLRSNVEPMESDRSFSTKPPWCDDVKVKIGQDFALKHFSSIQYAQMLSLMILFSFGGNTKPLIFTRKSDTIGRAGPRYLSTARRVLAWYEGDLWDEHGEAHENFHYVRWQHQSISKVMNGRGRAEVDELTKLRNFLNSSEIFNQSVSALNQDFKGRCPAYVSMTGSSSIFINQAEMSFTLFGFMGLIVLYPQYFGIHAISSDELDGFVHLWRVIGYKLGIQDHFNMCGADLDEVTTRCQDIIRLLFVPNLVSLNEEWEHLSRCMIGGVAMYFPGPNFEISLLYLFWLVGVDSPNFKKTVPLMTRVRFHFHKFAFYFLMRIPFFKRNSNLWLKEKLMKTAAQMSNTR